jgi:hypothetical protein
MNSYIASLLPSTADSAVAAGIMAVIMAVMAAFSMVFFVAGILMLVAGWKIYAKAGQPGWAVLIPIYNVIVFLRVVGLAWYWIFFPLVVLIPILGLFAYLAWAIWLNHRLSVRFGQGVGFTIGLVLLSPIFWLILAFGSSKYVGEQPAQA